MKEILIFHLLLKIISIKFEIQNEVNAAFDFAENSNFPKPEKLYQNIYMEKN